MAGSNGAEASPKDQRLHVAGRVHHMKSPFNHGSRDPLKPPSNHQNYTLFSGIPIRTLQGVSILDGFGDLPPFQDARSKALAQSAPKVLTCGSTKGKVNWDRLFKKENACIARESTFSRALVILRLERAGAPFLHTNLHLEQWFKKLQRINTEEAADAYWGVSRGLEVIPTSVEREPTNTPNYYDEKHADLVREELKRIMQDGYLATYAELKRIWPSLPDNVSDSLGLGFVVKRRADGTLKVRLIMDASRPSGSSVNSFIKEWSTALPTVFEFAKFLEQGDWMASADIADAYMNLGLQPDNWSHVTMNIALNSKENIDLAYCRLAFGIRSAVRMFQGIAALIKLMLQHSCEDQGFWHLIRTHVAYIDDSACAAITKAAAAAWLREWKTLMKLLGLPWSESKIVNPTQLLLFLGLIIQCMTSPTISVEQARLDKAVKLMAAYKKGGSFTLKEAQSVMGSIAFITQVVRFGKVFNRGLALQTMKFHDWARLRGMASSGRLLLPIDKRVLVDWSILEVVFESFNGIDATAPTRYPAAPAGPAQCDASFWGAGTWVHGHYSAVTWEEEGIEIFHPLVKGESRRKPKVSTAYVEALGLRQLLRHNAKYWVEKFIRINLDNSAIVACMRGERSKAEQVLPIILDCVSLIVAYMIKPHFGLIGTDDMWFADPLSRLTHPRKGLLYRKIFKARHHEWKRKWQPWIPSGEREPVVPHALTIPDRWKRAKRLAGADHIRVVTTK